VLLTPRYDGPPVLRYDGPTGDPLGPLLRQRRRLGALLDGLDDGQWAAASRCDGWSVREVVAHLVHTDRFWAASAGAGLAGEPTRILAAFDPVATPPLLVDASAGVGNGELLARYDAGVEGLAAVLGAVDGDRWDDVVAEAPPGHVPLRAVAAHALWDGWVHERDVVLPLGLEPTEEPDEVAVCLAYVAGLAPAFLATTGSTRTGTLAIVGRDPDVSVVVEAGETVVVSHGAPPPGAAVVEGSSVVLVEALSFRAERPFAVDDADRWLVDGLGTVFDRG